MASSQVCMGQALSVHGRGGGGEWRELNNIRAINFIRKTQEVVVSTRDACEGCWEIVSLKGEV